MPKVKCYQKSKLTKSKKSPKVKSHQKSKVTKIQRSQIDESHKNSKVTESQKSSKVKRHQKSKVTKSQKSKVTKLLDYKSTKNYTKNTFTLIPAMILYQLNKHLKTPDIEVTFSGLITIGE